MVGVLREPALGARDTLGQPGRPPEERFLSGNVRNEREMARSKVICAKGQGFKSHHCPHVILSHSWFLRLWKCDNLHSLGS